MNKNQLFIIGIIAVVAILLFSTVFSPPLDVVGNHETDYSTEYISCADGGQHWWSCDPLCTDSKPGHYYSWGNNPCDSGSKIEILNKIYYVSSWSQDGKSQELSLHGSGQHLRVKNGCDGLNCGPYPLLTDAYWKVEYWDGSAWTALVTTSGGNSIIDEDVVDVGLEGFGYIASSIGSSCSEAQVDRFFGCFDYGLCELIPWRYWNTFPNISMRDIEGINVPMDATFKFQGPLDMDIRVSLASRMVWYDCPSGSRPFCREILWATDYAKIHRGECSISIANSPNADPTIFEEGQTLKAYVTTDWSGGEEGGDQWRVTVYNPYGMPAGGAVQLIHPDGHTTGGTFPLEDSTDNYEIKWNIPTGIVDQYSGKYTWTWKIENILSQKCKTRAIVVKEGQSEMGPINTKVTIQNEGTADTFRTVRVEAEGNPEGTNDVDYFEVFAYRQTIGGGKIEYYSDVWNALPTGVPNKWYAEEDIDVPFNDEAFLVEIRPYDSNGFPGVLDSELEYVTDETLAMLIIKCVDSQRDPLPEVSISVGGIYLGKTDVNGRIDTRLSKGDTYTVSAVHDTWGSQTKQITLNFDPTEIEFQFGVIPWLTFLIPILIFIIFIVVGVVVPVWNPYVKILIIVVGLIIAIFVYCIMSGIIHIVGVNF